MAQVDDNTDDIEGEQDEISDIDSDTDMEQDEIDDIEDKMAEPIDVDVEVEGLEEGVELVAAPKPVTTSPATPSNGLINKFNIIILIFFLYVCSLVLIVCSCQCLYVLEDLAHELYNS